MKKVLIITYYWPPAGGSGVQRWLYFVKYLRDYGWEPVVYTPQNPDFDLQDESLVAEVPAGIEVIKRPIWEPYSLYNKFFGKKSGRQQGVVRQPSSWLGRLALWVRANLLVPDPRIFWVRPSVAFLSRYIRQQQVDALVTSGPPHSMHLIGRELHRRLQVPWLADFRDPWSEWDVNDWLQMGQAARRSQRRLEHGVLTDANLVTTVSPTLCAALTRLGGKRVATINNGFDLELPQDNTPPDKFRLAHVGLINRYYNPEKLWQVLDERCAREPEFANHLEVHLAGTVEQAILDSLNRLPILKDKVVYHGYLSHEQVKNLYEQSFVLLLPIRDNDNGRWILPGKMYEYLVYGRPILAVGPVQSDASDLLQQTGHQPCLAYDDKQGLAAFIDRAWQDYRQGVPRMDRAAIMPYHRSRLTEKLAGYLDGMQRTNKKEE